MDTSVALGVAGFLLGVRHAVDPDHVVAVTAIVARHPQLRRATLVGAWWGLGHTITLLVVGGAMVLFRVSLPPRVGLVLEFGVAVTLIALGFANLRRQAAPAAPAASAARPLAVGMVHGLAGSAAVALIVLAAVPNARWAVAYLSLFSAGTAIGMALVTTMIALPARASMTRFAGANRVLAVASGVVSIAFGLALACVILGPSGLLSSAPAWTPR